MLAGFGFSSKDFKCASNSILSQEHVKKEQSKLDTIGISMPRRASQISPDLMWIYKG